MADSLIFPIGFDLESGVQKVMQESDAALGRLQKTINGKPITLRVNVDTSTFETYTKSLFGSLKKLTEDANAVRNSFQNISDSLDVNNIDKTRKAMEALSKEWKAMPNNIKFDADGNLSAVAQNRIKKYNELAVAAQTHGQTLEQIASKIRRTAEEEARGNEKKRASWQKLRQTMSAQENSIANLTAKLKVYTQILNSREIGSKKFEQTARKIQELTQKLEQAKASVKSFSQEQTKAAFQVNTAYDKQYSYVDRLIRRMAVYWSVGQVAGFLSNIREVTAEFELQRISLGAILQDQIKANQLFSDIKAFAVKSPVRLLDLTKYVKQLAAYKIGYDDLFETTKRLTDISVGLGVSMDRIILLYGQIRATGYLRASEVRQATEAGIPLVEELAKKLTMMNGELVRSSDVMDMISKRQISFDMVKDVFEDMTSAGGAFYEMQEKQGNTLYGMWAKLGDAAAIMYDQIGNSEVVNEGMRKLITVATGLMRNWKSLAKTVGILAIAYIALNRAKKILLASSYQFTREGMREISQLRQNYEAAQRMRTATSSLGLATRTSAYYYTALASAQLKAATATNIFSKAMYKLKAAILSNPVGFLITALTTVMALFVDFDNSYNEFQSNLASIDQKYQAKQFNDAKNFTKLANTAVENADGSLAQKEALEELNRTYGEVLGTENLRIEALRAMKGEYAGLLDVIDAYNIKMKYQERKSEIEQFNDNEIKKAYEDYVDELATIFHDDDELKRAAATELASQVRAYIQDRIESGFLPEQRDISQIVKEFYRSQKAYKYQEGYDDINLIDKANSLAERVLSEQTALYEAMLSASNQLKANENAMNQELEQTNKYATIVEDLSKKLQSIRTGKLDTNEWNLDLVQDNFNAQTKEMVEALKKAFNEAGVTLDEGFYSLYGSAQSGNDKLSTIDFSGIINSLSSLTDQQTKAKLMNAVTQLQKLYLDFAPTDTTERVIANKVNEFARQFEVTAGIAQQFTLKSGESLDDLRKRIKDGIDGIVSDIERMNVALAGWSIADTLSGEQENALGKIDELEKRKQFLEEILKLIGDSKKNNNNKGNQSDPRLGILQEMASTLKSVNKEYTQLAQKEGATAALTDATKKYADTFKYLQELATKHGFVLPAFGVPKDAASLKKYLNAIKAEMSKLKKSDKAVLSIGTDIADIDMDEVQKKIDRQLKDLADRISRTKTAKEFYNKVLNATGDMRLADKISLSIFDSSGEELQEQMAAQLLKYFDNDKVKIEIPSYVMDVNGRIDYTALDQFADTVKDKLGEEPYKAVKKFAQEGQKELAKLYEGYLKDLEKAKSYSDKRIELARYTMSKISEIENSNLPQSEKDRLKAGYNERANRLQGQMEWDAFKDMPIYVQMFDDLDKVSTYMLTNMKAKLGELKSVWGGVLDPTQLKELQSRMNEIDAQISKRNPFKSLSDYIKQYMALRKNGTKADAENKLVQATQKHSDAVAKLNRELDRQKKAQEKYDNAVNTYGKGSNEANLAKTNLKNTADSVNETKQLVDATEEEVRVAQLLVDTWAQVTGGVKSSTDQVLGVITSIGDIASGIGKSVEALGGDAEDVQYWNDIASGVNEVTGAVSDFTKAIMSHDVAGIISSSINLVPSLISGFSTIFSAGKIRKANKEIKRQQEILEQLEYTYSRLESAADKVFGRDYINNYNEQIKNLQAQADAYQKQYQAEQSKGKKADKDKLKEYQEAYRDTMDEIADMKGQIAAQMFGSDLASAARDFASAWLDAYKEFSNTADAMSEKFREMINNMVVESLLAKVMERALEPAFKMIDGMSSQDFYSQSFWERVIATAEQGAKNADKGAQAMMKFLEQAGISMRDVNTEYTGIQRDIAGASEETMSSVAAIGNTLMYYVSAIPSIDSNVAIIRQIIEQSSPMAKSSADIDATALWNRHLELQQGIYEHTRQSAEKCEAMALKCTQIADDIHKVIVPRGGGSATASIQVRM